jgi:hypothetical protein
MKYVIQPEYRTEIQQKNFGTGKDTDSSGCTGTTDATTRNSNWSDIAWDEYQYCTVVIMTMHISRQFSRMNAAPRDDHDRKRRRCRTFQIWKNVSWLWLLLLLLQTLRLTAEATPSYLVTMPPHDAEECFEFRVPGEAAFIVRYVSDDE